MERIGELVALALDSENTSNGAQDQESGSGGVYDTGLSNTGAEHLEHHQKAGKSLSVSSDVLDVLWKNVCSQFERNLNPQIYSAWIKPLKLNSASLQGALLEVCIEAPNKFSAQHIQRNYLELVRASILQELSNSPQLNASSVQIKLSSTSAAVADVRPFHKKPLVAVKKLQSNSSPRQGQRQAKPQEDSSSLIAHYNFSNFVVGGCNQFAHAVSLQVSENLGSTYNPLFIYGGVGLGKTHLANAIGNASRRRGKKVLLVSSETFVSELITSLRSNSMDRFKNKFRSLDLLVIDDIQFIIGKERTQEEFFHTFNDLYNRNKQIIVTCDKVPQELVGLEDRLRTRFACGVSADLQAPDYETRVAILIKKAQTRNIQLPDTVARVLAERIDTNVRELEGALNRLIAMATLKQCEPSVELANEILQTISPSERIEVTTDRIQKVVAERFNVSIGDILGKRRTHNIAFARQVAMYLCREHTGCSYPELGALFGGRDHSTVIHARKVIAERLKNDDDFKNDLRQIQQSLHS